MSFFEGFDWEALLRKNMKVPYKPKKKNYREKKYNNYPLINLLEKEKKLLGKPETPTDPNWDATFDSK